MRATAQDPQAARLMGINVDTTISFTFLLGGLMAGAAGLIYALYQTDVWFFSGFTAGLIAFTAAVMGGIGNLKGAVLGGLIIGMIQQISDNRIGTEWTPAIVFGYLVLILVFRPAGPDRRADEGGGMSTLATRARAFKPPSGSARSRPSMIFTIAVIVIAVVLPFFYDSGSGFMNDATVALIYVVMALGLNIVVGFAGLLDLGYVAFFAIGAYTMGWLGSGFFSTADIHIGVSEQPPDPPGIHLNWLIVLPLAALVRGRRWAPCWASRRCACAATTSRS